jgi:DNA-binding CsgD family transcriptional regulator
MKGELTEREKQILQMIAGGLTNKSIAKELFIQVSTVENHIHKIYVKLNICNRSQATSYFFQMVSILSKKRSKRSMPRKIEESLHDIIQNAEYYP